MAGYVRQSVADIIDDEVIYAAPLNNEFNAIAAAFNSTSGHSHTGNSGDAPKLSLTAAVTGVLPLTNGGTGVNSISAFRTSLYSARILGIVGSDPFYTFAGDDNTGVGSAIANRLEFTAGGNLSAHVTNTQFSSLVKTSIPASGTETDPVFFFDGDSNTGIFSPAADNFAISTGGTTRITFNSLGTTIAGNATATRVLVAAGTAGSPTITFGSDTDTGFFRSTTNSIGISNGGTTTGVFDGSGMVLNVGTYAAPAGTAGAPAFTFAADSNTGIYRVGTDQLGISAAGATVASFSTTGILAFANILAPTGDKDAPGYSFRGDSNTGMFSPAANEITFSCGTSETLKLTGSLSTFVGTVVAPVVHSNAGTAAAPTHTFTSDTDTGMYRAGTNSLGFAIGGSMGMTLNSTALTVAVPLSVSGNTSIGGTLSVTSTSSFTGIATFGETVRASTGTAGAPSFTFSGDTDTGMYRSAANVLNFSVGGTSIFSVSSAGISTTQSIFSVGNINTDAGIVVTGSSLLRGQIQAGPTGGTAGTAASPTYSFASGTDTGMYRVAGDTLGFATAGTLGMQLTASQNVVVQGTVTELSDARLKTDVATLENALEKVKALRGVSYKKIGKDNTEIGLIAQEVEQVYPELIIEDVTETKSLSYPRLVAILIEAIKELSEEVEKLK